MKHFKGPLEAKAIYQSKNMFDLYLAEVHILGPVKDSGWQTYVASIAVHNMSEEQAIATGELFAAAPEMLDALKEFLRCGPDAGHNKELIAQIISAVLKATGQAST